MTPMTPRSNPTPFTKAFLVTAGLCGGLLGSFVAQSFVAQVAWAKPVLNDTSHFLLAQQVVDGLPPPPPVMFGQDNSANAQTPQQYLVVVNGDDAVLLSQVQQIQPSASVQEYNGQRFIQAGLFGDLNSAQQQVSTLAVSGIGAQVVGVTTASSTVSQLPATSTGSSSGLETQTLPPPELLPTTTVPSSSGGVEFGTAPAPQPQESAASSGRAYYVIIPGSGKDISAITSQVSRLTEGMGIDGMVQSGSSKGDHVRVGPFNSRSAANRWTRYFRDFGMDARVSFSR